MNSLTHLKKKKKIPGDNYHYYGLKSYRNLDLKSKKLLAQHS